MGLPLVAGGLRTTSHEPDWQACQQDAFVSMTTTASGADVTGGAGTLGAATAFSPQQLVMDSEIFSWNAAIAAGIDVHDETIALDAIKQVGIGGNYLGQRHTRRHMKDVWRPRLLDRSMWDAWIASGREGAYEKATALAGGAARRARVRAARRGGSRRDRAHRRGTGTLAESAGRQRPAGGRCKLCMQGCIIVPATWSPDVAVKQGAAGVRGLAEKETLT